MAILTVTPNPAFDRIQTISHFAPGQVCRAEKLALSAGGKGVNVARAAIALGEKATCAGLLGGHSGRMEAQFVSAEGIPAQWTWIDGETRVSVIVIDPQNGETSVLNEAGPTVTEEDWARLQAEVLKLAEAAQATCISGSLPPGLHAEAMGRLVQALNRARQQVWVDTSGASLKAAVQARPLAIKVNNFEAAALLGWREIKDVSDALHAARTIQNSGVSKVALTLGKAGAVLCSDAGAWHAKPPAIDIVCPVGSGDAFLAGLMTATGDQRPDPEALRCAVAAGSANALSIGGGKFTQEAFEQIFMSTKLTAY
ncbi:MAG: 1-phosphofructokinase family hexose kinase [Chloroflexota bacterium]